MISTICRTFHFNAAHRLHNPNWSEEKNIAVFGKCNNPNFHGHNYELIIKVTGEVDVDTGYVMDTKLLKQLVETEVLDQFDHRNLNLDIEIFKTLNPTAEHIAYVIYHQLLTKIDSNKKLAVILYETERNYVEYNGE